MDKPHVMSGGRYPVLRALAILYVIGAAVAILGGVITAGWLLLRAPDSTWNRVVLALSALAATFFVTITMLAIAELLKLFIDVEHNTRASAMRGTTVTAVGDGGAVIASNDGGRDNVPGGRLHELDEETAEAALLRGH